MTRRSRRASTTARLVATVVVPRPFVPLVTVRIGIVLSRGISYSFASPRLGISPSIRAANREGVARRRSSGTCCPTPRNDTGMRVSRSTRSNAPIESV